MIKSRNLEIRFLQAARHLLAATVVVLLVAAVLLEEVPLAEEVAVAVLRVAAPIQQEPSWPLLLS